MSPLASTMIEQPAAATRHDAAMMTAARRRRARREIMAPTILHEGDGRGVPGVAHVGQIELTDPRPSAMRAP